MSIFKCWKGKDKWLFLLTIGAVLCILALPMAEEETKEIVSQELTVPVVAETQNEESYEKELEERIETLLKTVDGVGKVKVMVIVKSSSELVIQTDATTKTSLTEETDTSGGIRQIESREEEEDTVFSSLEGNTSPVIQKEIKPELSGIIISATGGGNQVVKAEISAAMEALFGLPQHKIKVLKMVE